MKLNAKCLRFYDNVHQELYGIGTAIADSLGSHLYCESFEILQNGVQFNIWQAGIRGGSNEAWTLIDVSFETLLLDDPISTIVTQIKAKRQAEKELADKQKQERVEREERATLERLKQKYSHQSGNPTNPA